MDVTDIEVLVLKLKKRIEALEKKKK